MRETNNASSLPPRTGDNGPAAHLEEPIADPKKR